jgi:hypothetical protein
VITVFLAIYANSPLKAKFSSGGKLTRLLEFASIMRENPRKKLPLSEKVFHLFRAPFNLKHRSKQKRRFLFDMRQVNEKQIGLRPLSAVFF